jgi:hypothetical protein
MIPEMKPDTCETTKKKSLLPHPAKCILTNALSGDYALQYQWFPESTFLKTPSEVKEMRKSFMGAVVGLAAVLCFSSVAMAQMAQPQSKAAEARSPWKYYPTDVPPGDGGPAPKRDLSGTWNGPGSSDAIPSPTGVERPSLTPLGQKLMSERKPIGRFGPAGTNDPTSRFCDPLGFPQNLVYQSRALSIATMPNRIALLYQFGGYWREIWTDGRALPTNVGGPERDALDPTYMGYSVGRWEDDYNFVVDTTGMDERTWVARDGTPHSVDAHVHERWTRVDHNTLKVSLSIDDPKMFTKPYSLGTYTYKWVPNQKINEWLCVPSDQIKYLTQQGDPAGYPAATEQRGGGGGGAAAGGGGGGRGGAGGGRGQ